MDDFPSPRVGRWIARPRKPIRMVPKLIVVPVLGQIPAVFHAAFGIWSWSPIVLVSFFLSTAIVAFFVLSSSGACMGRSQLYPEDCNLAEYAFGDQYAAEVDVYVRGSGLGADRGVIWFDQGLMGFSGAAFSFVLATWDVRIRHVPRLNTRDWTLMPPGAIELVDAPDESYLFVLPLGKGTVAFKERLRRFENENADLDAERFWPPLAPYNASTTLPAARKRLTR